MAVTPESQSELSAGDGDELWNRTQSIFLAVLDLPDDSRGGFLDNACNGDRQLRAEVESLLAHDRGEGNLSATFQQAAASIIAKDSLVGQRAGTYQIISELGRGGMGAVYRAVRADDEFRKEVAIKVVKRGMDTDAMLDRFRYERQILANLDHPYIARLLDGGSIGGQPFFVMELVEGLPIDTYCREHSLSTEDRCRLLFRVCEAVSYAHRNLVVHRDLKPSNILVTTAGSPKLLDFGVAKLLSADANALATVTRVAQRALTPEYASPEHIRGLPATTASDVYALAAVLYELVTGQRAHQLPADRPDEWEQIICTQEVARFVEHNRQLPRDLETILLMALRKDSERRYPSVEQFAADLQRFLDGLPVLAREDSLGYRTAKFLRRNRIWLTAAGVAVASLLVATGVSFNEARKAHAALRVAETSKRAVEHERERAEEHSREADAARAIAEKEHALAQGEAANARNEERRANQRLTQIVDLSNRSLFDIHADIERLPGATAARQKLEGTTLAFLESLGTDTGSDERLKLALGAAYLRIGDIQGNPNMPSLGDAPGAMKSYAKAEQLIRPLLAAGARTAHLLRVWVDLAHSKAQLLNSLGQPAAAAAVLRETLPFADELIRAENSDTHRAVLKSSLLFFLQSSRPEEASVYGKQAIEELARLAIRKPGSLEIQHEQATAYSVIAMIYRRRGGFEEALSNLRTAEQLQEALLKRQPDDALYQRELMIIYGKLAVVLEDRDYERQDVKVARAYYLKAAEIARHLNRADPLNRVAQYDLASVELRLGSGLTASPDKSESLALLQRASRTFESLAASEPRSQPYKSGLMMVYRAEAENLRDAGQLAGAVEQYKKSLAVAVAIFTVRPQDGSILSNAANSEQAIASLYARMGDQQSALDYARSAVKRMEQNQVLASASVRAKSYFLLGQIARQFGNWDEAGSAAGLAGNEWRVLLKSSKNKEWTEELAKAEALTVECEARKGGVRKD